MTHDQALVQQLQHRLPNWNPDERCKDHWSYCAYDQQGRLITLHLCRLGLSQVPSEVWLFSMLQTLYLDYNQLRTLPAEIGQLSSLQALSLSHNQLSTLPAVIGQLTHLHRLDLRYNQLSTLPAEIGQLTHLQTLYLAYNQLSTLPAVIGQLPSLHRLALDNNPLRIPPSEIIAQGTWAIRAYLRTLQQTGVEVARASASIQTQPLVATATASPTPSMSPAPIRPISIFYCYAHKDRDLRDRIDKHLGVLKQMGQVTAWYDREIQAGTEWEREISTHLSAANIILLLVSANFMNSDYCYGVEMQKAMEMHEKGEAHVLPILLRPVNWQDAPFAKLQLLPTGARPITKWPDPEEALEDVAKQIRAVVTTLRTLQG